MNWIKKFNGHLKRKLVILLTTLLTFVSCHAQNKDTSLYNILMQKSLNGSKNKPILQTKNTEDRLIFINGCESFYLERPMEIIEDCSFDKFGEYYQCIEIWVNSKATKGQELAFKKKEIDYLKINNLSIRNYDKYKHTLTKYKFNCHENKVMLLDYYDYNEYGNIISSSNGNSEWINIIPGSIAEELRQFACGE